MPDDVFLQVQDIHQLLVPARPTVLANPRRPSWWRRLARLPWLDAVLFLSTAAAYILVQRQASDITVTAAAVVVLVLFVARLLICIGWNTCGCRGPLTLKRTPR